MIFGLIKDTSKKQSKNGEHEKIKNQRTPSRNPNMLDIKSRVEDYNGMDMSGQNPLLHAW